MTPKYSKDISKTNSAKENDIGHQTIDSGPRKIKSNFVASSPIREKARQPIEIVGSKGNNTSADLTKVSIIAENTPKKQPPRKSSSPVNFTHSVIKETKNKSKQFSVETINSSQLPSVISSVASTITNVSQNPEIATNNLANFNRVSVSSIASNNTHTQIERNFRPKGYELDNINEINSTTETDLKETDEILRILFKKNYFYQLKLK